MGCRYGMLSVMGHGPFSHVFEIFMKKANPELNWTHEKASIEMFEQLINNRMNGKSIWDTMVEYGLDEQDIVFIEELIFGPNPPTERNNQLPMQHADPNWSYKGRAKDKSYLYEIVANKSTGIDVNKMDYFSRDCLHLGMKSNFSHERYMKFARVCTTENDEKKICMRDKEALNMYELFHVRYLLHQNAYQHRVKKAIEMMIIDALLAAEDENFTLDGKKISETVSDMSIYLKLTDNILDDIKHATQIANNLIEKIERRDLYRFVGGKLYKNKPITDMKEEINIDYGKKKENPIDSLWFYRRGNVRTAIKLMEDEVSYIKPAVFQETRVFLFYMKSSAHGLKDEHLAELWKLIEK
ncbi:deoxynucleoside triphosphate triphosphohydrolase SAMHD1-like [Tachysurus ichikawai]